MTERPDAQGPHASGARSRRRAEILEAARSVLAETGYERATMAQIARRARASKETLYSWFGDKQGLFAALVAANAERLRAALETTLQPPDAADQVAGRPRTPLRAFAAGFLELLLGDTAVAINRAAIADAADPQGGELAGVLSREGRAATFPVLLRVLETERAAGRLAFDDVEEAGETLLGLLLTDRQIRRLLGALPAPDAAWVARRADSAVDRFLLLYGPD